MIDDIYQVKNAILFLTIRQTLLLITYTKVKKLFFHNKNILEKFRYGVTNLKNYYFISNIGGCNIKIFFFEDSHVVSFINSTWLIIKGKQNKKLIVKVSLNIT